MGFGLTVFAGAKMKSGFAIFAEVSGLEKRIRAAIDVTDPEPLPAGHPLWKAPNLMITPHIGGASPRFLKRALKLASDQAERFARGEPLLNVVDGDY